jgi:hypothetical protein
MIQLPTAQNPGPLLLESGQAAETRAAIEYCLRYPPGARHEFENRPKAAACVFSNEFEVEFNLHVLVIQVGNEQVRATHSVPCGEYLYRAADYSQKLDPQLWIRLISR